MQYQGGKSRLAKRFAHVLERALEETNGFLYEPFTGGFNIQPALREGLVRRAINGDAHLGLITLYRALQQGWIPPAEMPRETWEALRAELDYTKPITAFAAFGCSYQGQEFAGYAGLVPHKSGIRDFPRVARDSLLRKAARMGPVEFRWQDFEGSSLDCDLEGPATIYVDPPYVGTAGYLSGTGFDHARFYRWIGRMADAGHVVLMSEATPPSGVRYSIPWTETMKVPKSERTRTEYVFRIEGTE